MEEFVEHASGDTGEMKAHRKDIVLESFFYILTGHIDNFKNLVNVHLRVFVVIGQPVTSLDGIEQLKNLAELWVCECHLQDASYVNSCHELKRLHLYSNRLKSVPKMTRLSKLTNLSLASNFISTLTPHFPESLRELNLADNNIADISELESCRQLEILNIAGNNIRTFRALSPLIELPKLKYLYLIDQVYKNSPVTSLPNYRSHLVHSMEHLKSLDGFPVEEEEKANCRHFFGRKFCHYQVQYHNFINSFFVEHRKLLSQSYTNLSNLKNAILNTTVALTKFSENSSIGKECRKKLQKYEISQFHWEYMHRNWYTRLQKELLVKLMFLEMEMTQYGTVNFYHYEKGANGVVNRVTEIMQNCICPYTKRNMNLTSVVIDQVVQVVNTHHHCFHKFRGVKEIMGVGVAENQFFIIGDPVSVSDASQWPFQFIKDFLDQSENDKMNCKVTNSLSIADSTWLNKNQQGKSMSITQDLLKEQRVLVLGYVISDELMGSFTREVTAKLHLKSNSEPTEHCYHCAVYSSVIPDNVIPAFIVEFHYLFKENNLGTLGNDFTFPEGENAVPKLAIASSKFNFTSWQNLNSLNLSKSMLSSFGPLTTFEGIIELDVSYNHISSLNELAKIFPKLINLNAQFNEITSTNIGKEFKVIKILNLKFNKLTKFIPSLQWLKKFCKSLEQLDVGYNPFNDINDHSHKKYIVVKYFPEFRKLDDEWLDDARSDQMVYKFCLKDLPSVVVDEKHFENIKSTPKVLFNGANCVRERCVPCSHCALNEYNDLVCVHIIEGKLFQSINIDIKISSLRWVTIQKNLLSSINFITECPKLEEIDVSFNIIQSISSVFENSKYLVKLNLMGNYIKDLEGFSKFELPNLKVLNVSYNCVRKIDGLRNLNQLEKLYAAGNDIQRSENLQFIKDWKNLKVIDLSNNPFEDIEILRKFLIYHGSHLEYINGVQISEEEISDANDTLSGTLNKNYMVKIYKPNQLKSLTELTVKKCGIRKVNLRDSDFQNLTSINLESNALTVLGSLSYLRQLKHLCLANNKISSFGEFNKSFESLESLHLNSNSIADLEPLELERFPKLIALYLQENELTSVCGIKGLRRLQYLVLDRNQLTFVKPEDVPLESLREMYAEHNQIKDLAFLRNFKNLKKLFLAHNKIQDQSTLEHLSALKKLVELTVVGNPVCRLNSHYLLVLTLNTRLSLLDGHSVAPPRNA